MRSISMKQMMKSLIIASMIAVSAITLNGMSATETMADELPASTRLAMPGEKHAWMKPLVGNWNVEMLVYPGPGAQPIISKELSAKRELILDGRYLREELSGKFAGFPSSRIATLGYNGLDERFELVTVDTFEPGVMVYYGNEGGSSSLISMQGESTEAGMAPKPTGRKRDLRFDWEITDAGSVQKIYVKYPGEPEFLFVEQRFTPKN